MSARLADMGTASAETLVGVLLDGTGQAWIADIAFKVVGKEVPVTDDAPEINYPDEPVNLDFRA